jgi:hypothetical protein
MLAMTSGLFVMAGLDPAIHRLREKRASRKKMDARVKPAHDGARGS